MGDLTFGIENFQKNFTETERPPNDRKIRPPWRAPGSRAGRDYLAIAPRLGRDGSEAFAIRE